MLAFVVALLFAPTASAHERELPLGSPSLHETRTSDILAPGVSYTRIVRGELSPRDGWAVDVLVTASRANADAAAAKVRVAGFDAAVDALPGPPDRRWFGAYAFRVRSGLFGTRAEADARGGAIVAAGQPVRGSVFTAEDGERTSGPWVVHVLSVEPWAHRRVAPALANDVVVDRELLSVLSARKGAVASINGGSESQWRQVKGAGVHDVS